MFDYIKKHSVSSMFHTVIFTGGEFPSPKDTSFYWKNLPPPNFVIAADSGLETLVKFQTFFLDNKKLSFYPDLILGDMDSISDKTIINQFRKATVEKFPSYKDYTDTELALERSFENGKSFVTLIGGSGGRIDHFLGIYDLFSTSCHPSVWLTNTQSLWFAPKKSIFRISNVTPSDMISIARVNGNRFGGKIFTSGFEWESKTFRKNGMPSISNRISSETFKNNSEIYIKIKRGDFILIAPLFASVKFDL